MTTSTMNLRGVVPLHSMSIINTIIKFITEVNSIKAMEVKGYNSKACLTAEVCLSIGSVSKLL